ncbi:STAS domain-containing protein [bacterium]|nr:STAS domain-containing protein [bacterium]
MFQITIEKDLLILEGRFDASREAYALEMFDRVSETATVDFATLEYISSSGLGVLLATQKRLKESGSELKLINLTDHIRDIFHYAGFDLIFSIADR